jgi:branched-chain amino acid transport system permease protein
MIELFAAGDVVGDAGGGAGFGQYLMLGLVLGSLYALIAIGYTMVYGIVELINFAHGDLFMLGSFLALQLAWWLGYDPASTGDWRAPAILIIPLMFVIAPLFCAALNVATDFVIYKPLRNSPKLTVIVSAIGVSFIFMNVGLFWYGATPVKFPDLISDTNLIDGSGLKFTWKDVMVVGVTVPAMIALTVFVKFTSLG